MRETHRESKKLYVAFVVIIELFDQLNSKPKNASIEEYSIPK